MPRFPPSSISISRISGNISIPSEIGGPPEQNRDSDLAALCWCAGEYEERLRDLESERQAVEEDRQQVGQGGQGIGTGMREAGSGGSNGLRVAGSGGQRGAGE